jgi:hypothetical protein
MKHQRGGPAGSFANVMEISQLMQRKISKIALKSKWSRRMPGSAVTTSKFWARSCRRAILAE